MAKYSRSRRDPSPLPPSEPAVKTPAERDKHREELWALVDELTAVKRVSATATPASAAPQPEKKTPAPPAAPVPEKAPTTVPKVPEKAAAVEPAPKDAAAADDTPPAVPPFPMSTPPAFVPEPAEPEKPAPKRRRVWPWILLTVLVALLSTVVIFVLNGGLTVLADLFAMSASPSSAPTTPTTVTTTTTTPTTTTTAPPAPRPQGTLPSPLRGGFFELDTLPETEEGWTESIGATLDLLAEWNFNVLMLPIETDGNTFYLSAAGEPADAAFDPLAAILDAAKIRGVSVVAVVDIGIERGVTDPLAAADVNALVKLAAPLTDLAFDGYLLTGYCCADYDAAPEGTTAAITAAVKKTATALKEGGKVARPVGLLADPLWADVYDQEDGLYTEAYLFADLTDGLADTRGWIVDGTFDFVMVHNDRTIGDYALSFEDVLEWWDALCEETNVPLYTLHASDLIGSDEYGWEMPEELSLQCEASQRTERWQGCAFTSLTALYDNEDALEMLLRQLSNEPEEDETSHTLVFSSPTATEISTTDSVISFQGSADPDFPLWLDGEEVELSEQGLFGVDCPLEIGDNFFTFVHKGKTVTYSVFYEIEVLRSVAPERDLYLSGGAAISISAIAYKDAVVSARIGDSEIPMTLSPLQNEEDARKENEEYENFACSFTLPESVEDEQSLGYITVFASYGEQLDVVQGGLLVVKAKPTKPPTTTTIATTTTTTTTTTTAEDGEGEDGDGDASSTDPDSSDTPAKDTTSTDTTITTTTTAPLPDIEQEVLAEGPLVLITEDYAETFDGETVEDYSRPLNAYMPQGTLDVLINEVYDSASDNEYYLLGCGRRVYKSAAEIYSDYGELTSNLLTAKDVAVGDGYTTLTFGSLWNVPYQLQFLPQSYPRSGEEYPLYDIDSMTATHIDITFYYTAGVSGTPDISDSPLFSSAKWIEGENNTQKLRLVLRRTGEFYGYFVEWTDAGELVFRFRHPTYIGDNDADTPLAGLTIVVDAGHGGDDGGATGNLPNSTVYEKKLTLTYAQELRKQLKALGATVVMTRTDDYNLAAHDITVISRETQPDLFISVHMNSYFASSPNGPSTHYFNEYSYALANSIFEEMYEVYSDEKDTQERGARWDPFYVTRVHDCPSVLLECGFMSNPHDLELLCDKEFRVNLCAAIVRGVQAYADTLPQV